ncbi:hypothetical protein GE09DRAFT_1227832 [Coniochaeta sp. 2T2.1]|nr:hypothetical protein GE09DRAFT_1227832 [Coniochaeta sp. 2T2.1]
MSSNNNNTQTPSTQPGLVGSHAAIGNLTSSHAWTSSGEQDKAHAKAEMRAAAENRDPHNDGYGKVEEVAGKVTGCEGMAREGAASKERTE